MNSTHVMAKGQVVIPAELRRKYDIKKGTRVNFLEEGGRIVLQPVTRELIHSFRGILKVRPGEKPVTEQLLEDHAEELRKEEAWFARLRSR
ncbi:MAG: AbrB/MazE/SpoVT family DNA-binding domain-containing protein [Planctomycetes bacterium]|nr:AbrB/MazE/SpoVT family DNA-binding domain-containing protein [Planctomycetota bacterium]